MTPVALFMTAETFALVSEFTFYRLQEGQKYADENGLFFMETSAKNAQNVNEIFYEIGIQTFFTLECAILQIVMSVRIPVLFVIMIMFNELCNV